ncbi:MAG: hypothetical protein WC001_01755 [Desulfurivibrionaceae bacterium]
MSRLYNTLEKIRATEHGAAPGQKSAPATGTGQPAGKRGMRLFVFLGTSLALLLALLIFFSGPKRKNSVRQPEKTAGVTSSAVAPAPTTGQAPGPAPNSQAPAGRPPSVVASPGNYQQLNDTGLALIKDNQPWRGLYQLDKARRQQPERPEALINMAVTLAEMGLSAPAKRLFHEAHALAPNHPMLRKNLDLLARNDLLDRQWLFSLSAGDSGPKQTTPPQ